MTVHEFQTSTLVIAVMNTHIFNVEFTDYVSFYLHGKGNSCGFLKKKITIRIVQIFRTAVSNCQATQLQYWFFIKMNVSCSDHKNHSFFAQTVNAPLIMQCKQQQQQQQQSFFRCSHKTFIPVWFYPVALEILEDQSKQL